MSYVRHLPVYEPLSTKASDTDEESDSFTSPYYRYSYQTGVIHSSSSRSTATGVAQIERKRLERDRSILAEQVRVLQTKCRQQEFQLKECYNKLDRYEFMDKTLTKLIATIQDTLFLCLCPATRRNLLIILEEHLGVSEYELKKLRRSLPNLLGAANTASEADRFPSDEKGTECDVVSGVLPAEPVE
ncbi:hypothetical protein SJAG_03109 [Schizosaccharomyces japonicus yFS275]|uniref:Uncharacterized protein n=1 Tax=Schizosaccharomyces japonicus (strain yFS275 / FY16936) TaxID=402676 RepID=B6K3C5_SCHJY|nr:hypothetical protein SJAG_03109 [Schizosaccharomyces japonicus yFS275]EEB07982.1 hypothetical protein SJAG_03109 [Schizosaccharomyces japonicus yFS275]